MIKAFKKYLTMLGESHLFLVYEGDAPSPRGLKMEFVLAIDPGLSGGFMFFDGSDFEFTAMPLVSGQKEIDFFGIQKILKRYPEVHIFLERAMPFAMGSKHAFNYGRGFAALEIAIKLSKNPVTYIEPNKWTKVMHEGTDAKFKAKERSLIAAQRLFPKIFSKLPRAGATGKSEKVHDGAIDSLLIAAYALRRKT